MLAVSSNPVVIMLMIVLFLFVSGMFIDTTSNIVLFAPLFYPIVARVGYDVVYFGVLMTINLCIGFLTPPLGMNLFVAQGISKQSLENIVKQNMPFLLVLIVVMFIIVLFSDITLFLPNLLWK